MHGTSVQLSGHGPGFLTRHMAHGIQHFINVLFGEFHEAQLAEHGDQRKSQIAHGAARRQAAGHQQVRNFIFTRGLKQPPAGGQRQQAGAIIAARQRIVEGAVGMVEMALAMLSHRQIVALDDERKAAMVSNLLVVLCAEG